MVAEELGQPARGCWVVAEFFPKPDQDLIQFQALWVVPGRKERINGNTEVRRERFERVSPWLAVFVDYPVQGRVVHAGFLCELVSIDSLGRHSSKSVETRCHVGRRRVDPAGNFSGGRLEFPSDLVTHCSRTFRGHYRVEVVQLDARGASDPSECSVLVFEPKQIDNAQRFVVQPGTHVYPFPLVGCAANGTPRGVGRCKAGI